MSLEPMTVADVRKLLDRGTPQSQVRERLRQTGVWSDAGASEIVKFMSTGPTPCSRIT